jgi:SWI/SNF-related matrix-associated actin-dependent regulator 1 of chromatin subfamily A
MTPLQRSIYREALQRSRKMLQSMPDEIKPQDISSGTATPTLPAKGKKAAAASKPKKKAPIQTSDTSSHVLMDLRKAASHPMLFRRRFDDAKIKLMARHCLKEPEFMDSNLEYVIEDMQVRTSDCLDSYRIVTLFIGHDGF